MISPSEILFTLGDLKRLFIRKKQSLWKVAALFALLTFFYLSFKEPRFQATATFRQAQSADDGAGKLRAFLNVVMVSGEERGAAPLMLSARLGRVVVEKLGLQAHVHEQGFLAEKMGNFWGNLCRELGRLRKDPESFVFQDVLFEEEKPLPLFLRFKSREEFDLLDAKKELLGVGKLGEAFKKENLVFTLVQVPSNLSQKKLYPFALAPWPAVVGEHLARLQIKPLKGDKNILRLFYRHKSRHVAARFLNEMMSTYQNYLKQENTELSDAQLAYLERRQEELRGKLDRVLEEQVSYLKENLGERGFIGLKEEVEMLAIPKESYTTRLFDLEMEQRRLEKEEETPVKRARVENIKHPDQTKAFEQRLTKLQLDEVKLDGSSTKERLEGITLATAQSLHTTYQKELDEVQKNIGQLIYFGEKIFSPAFELSSLSAILSDSVGQSMVQKAAEISLKLKDEKNHSQKEMVRLQEALETEKTFLSHHMQQMVELEKVRKKLVEEKIRTLQVTCLDLIKKEKGLVEEKLKELTAKMGDLPEKWKRESHLQFAKELNMGIMEGISKVVESKNLTHNLFHVDSKPIDKALPPLLPAPPMLLLFSVSGGVLAAFLLLFFHVGKGLIYGFPLSFEALPFYGFHGVGFFSEYSHAPFKEVSGQDLQTLRQIERWISEQKKECPCVVLIGGRLPDYSSNLAELIALQKKRVLLIDVGFDKVIAGEKGGLWHYLEGQVEKIVPEKRKGFDFIPAGGTSRHAPELLSRESFARLLATLKPDYDLILIYTTALPAFPEAHLFFKYADAILLSCAEERAADLLPYQKWEKEREARAFSVVCMESS